MKQKENQKQWKNIVFNDKRKTMIISHYWITNCNNNNWHFMNGRIYLNQISFCALDVCGPMNLHYFVLRREDVADLVINCQIVYSIIWCTQRMACVYSNTFVSIILYVGCAAYKHISTLLDREISIVGKSTGTPQNEFSIKILQKGFWRQWGANRWRQNSSEWVFN